MKQEQNILQKTSPKDFFLHLLAISGLYGVAVSFLVLVFQYVNLLLPDVLAGEYYYMASVRSTIHQALASIIIIFPVYVWAVRFLNKAYARFPKKRELRVRKWLVYFTLFVAALIVIGDLITLLYNFLDGELTWRFVLKVLAVLLTAGSVFIYYFVDIKRGKAGVREPKWFKIFTRGVMVVVVAAIVAGFVFSGSPFEQRKRKADEKRIQNLQYIQQEVINYWLAKDVLPEKLSDMEDATRGVSIPKDALSGAEYEYSVGSPEDFVFCAMFDLPSDSRLSEKTFPADPYFRAQNQNWSHPSGRTCFERKIDKDFYPQHLNASKPLD